MTQLMALDGGLLREPTTEEVFDWAGRMCREHFPRPYRLLRCRDTQRFVARCLPQQADACFVVIVTDDRHTAAHYHFVPLDTALIAAQLTMFALMTKPVWMVSAQPGPLPNEDAVGAVLTTEFAARGLKHVRYLRVDTAQPARIRAVRSIAMDTPLWAVECRQLRPASPTDVLRAAHVLNTRRLLRPLVVITGTDARAQPRALDDVQLH